MCARHGIKGLAHFGPEQREDERVARPAMVRSQDYAMPGLERRLEALYAVKFQPLDTPLAASVTRQPFLHEPRPKRAMMWRSELIRLGDDDLLHRALSDG